MMCALVRVFQSAKPDDSFLREVEKKIVDEFECHGHEVEVIDLSNLSIAPCKGCFGCWVHSPGRCVIDDDGAKLTGWYLHADAVVLLSRICFGGYCSTMKRCMDRLIPMVLPFFRNFQGETHHKMRYESYPMLLSVGVLDEDDSEQAELFQHLVFRNALNFCPKKTAIAVLQQKSSNWHQQLSGPLKNIGGEL